jgi:hypothetical protein
MANLLRQATYGLLQFSARRALPIDLPNWRTVVAASSEAFSVGCNFGTEVAISPELV